MLNQKRNPKLNWLIPFLFWLVITLRIFFFYVPVSVIYQPLNWAWRNSAMKVSNVIPEKFRLPAGAFVVVAVFFVGAFATEESAGNTRANRAISLFGLLVLITVLWATSRDRKAIKWHTVIVGMLIQYLIALFVLRSSVGFDIFQFVSGLARDLLGFAGKGTAFLTTEEVAALPWFLIGVLPAIIFFVALVQMVCIPELNPIPSCIC